MIMNEQEIRKEFEMFSDFWRFRKAFLDVRDTEEYWEAVVKAGNDLYARYQTELCKTIVLDIIDDLEEKCKQKNTLV